MPILIDRVGSRFGRLVVTRQDLEGPLTREPTRTYWVCMCDCGREVSVSGHSLSRGNSRSCGCLHREVAKAAKLIHGHAVRGGALSSTYASWTAAKDRCFNPNKKHFDSYGGRGITMNEEWRQDFLAFLRDMGARPLGMTLDRIDPNGHYEAGNCRWATRATQGNNKRTNLVWRGENLSIKQIAQREGLPVSSVFLRYKKDGDIGAAVEYVRSHPRRQGKSIIRPAPASPTAV